MAKSIESLEYRDVYRRIQNGDIAPVYIVTGEERYLLRQLLIALDKALVNDASRGFDRADFSEKAPLSEVTAALQTPPFLSRKKLVVVRNCKLFENSKSQQGTLELAGIGDLHTLVLIEDKVLKSGQAAKYLNAAAAGGGLMVTLTKQKEPQLIDFISRQARSRGFKVSRSAATLLIERTESDMSSIAGELCKAFNYLTYIGSDTLDDASVELLVKKPLASGIFDLMDAVSDKMAGKALAHLAELLDAKEPLQRISYTIMRHLRRLIVVRDAGSVDTAAVVLNVSPYRAKHLMRQAMRFTLNELEAIHRKGSELDQDIRKGLIPDRTAMELFLAFACEVA